MTTVNIMLHGKQQKTKPAKHAYGSFKMASQVSVRELTLTEMAQYIQKGHVFYPSVHHLTEETIKASTFASQQLVAVDFDNNKENPCTLSMEDHINQLETYGYDVAIAYKTQSYTQDVPKFRFIFLMDTTYTTYSEELFNATQGLYRFFNQNHASLLVDPSCNDASRLFNGGLYNADVYVNENARPVNAKEVIAVSATLQPLPQAKEATFKQASKKIASTEFKGFELLKAFQPESLASHYKAQDNFVPEETTVKAFMNQLAMDSLFDFPVGSTFIDVFHDENNASAKVYENDIHMYSCFSGSSYKAGYTVARIIEEVHGKDAYTFMKRFMEQFKKSAPSPLRQTVASNKAFAKSVAFKTKAPHAYKILSRYGFGRRLFTVQEVIADRTEGAEMVTGTINTFFSIRTIVDTTKGSKAATSIESACELMAFAALTGFVTKYDDASLTEEATASLEKQRTRTAKTTGTANVKRLSVYAFTDLASLTEEELTALDEKAQHVLTIGTSVSKMNMAYVIGAYGEATAKAIYPTERIQLTFTQQGNNSDVLSAVRKHIQTHGYVYKAIMEEQFKGTMSRRQFENAYTAAIVELGLVTESATDDIMHAFGIQVSRRTKISYNKEAMATPAPQETSAFLTELLASLEETTEETVEVQEVIETVVDVPQIEVAPVLVVVETEAVVEPVNIASKMFPQFRIITGNKKRPVQRTSHPAPWVVETDKTLLSAA